MRDELFRVVDTRPEIVRRIAGVGAFRGGLEAGTQALCNVLLPGHHARGDPAQVGDLAGAQRVVARLERISRRSQPGERVERLEQLGNVAKRELIAVVCREGEIDRLGQHGLRGGRERSWEHDVRCRFLLGVGISCGAMVVTVKSPMSWQAETALTMRKHAYRVMRASEFSSPLPGAGR